MVFMKVLDVVIFWRERRCFEKDERKREVFFVFLEIFGFDAVCTESLFEIYSQLFFFPCSFPLFWSLSCTNFKIVEMFFFFKFQEVKHKFCTFSSHRKSMYELLDYYHEFKI